MALVNCSQEVPPINLRINHSIFWFQKVVKPSILTLERSQTFKEYVIKIWEKIIQTINCEQHTLNFNFCKILSKVLTTSPNKLGYGNVNIEFLEFPITCLMMDLDEAMPIFLLLKIHLSRKAMQNLFDSYTLETPCHFAAKVGNLSLFKLFAPNMEYKNQFCHVLPDYYSLSVIDTASTFHNETIVREIMNPANSYLKRKYEIMWPSV